MMKKIFVVLLALTAVLNLDAQTVEKHASEDVKIGIAGFTFRKFKIDETLGYLQKMGVHYMSVKSWWLPLEATKEEMDTFKEKCASYDVEPYILGPIYMRSQEDVDRTFAYAERFGAKMFIGVPNYELLDYTIQKVKETGIKVAIHTHGPDNAAFPDIREIVARVGDPSLGIGCCMDLGHSTRFGNNASKDIVKYRKWIYDIHIKDESAPSKEGKTWEMGRGVMDFVPIVKALKKIGYTGVVCLEFEKDGKAPQLGVAESIGYLRGTIDASYR